MTQRSLLAAGGQLRIWLKIYTGEERLHRSLFDWIPELDVGYEGGYDQCKKAMDFDGDGYSSKSNDFSVCG